MYDSHLLMSHSIINDTSNEKTDKISGPILSITPLLPLDQDWGSTGADILLIIMKPPAAFQRPMNPFHPQSTHFTSFIQCSSSLNHQPSSPAGVSFNSSVRQSPSQSLSGSIKITRRPEERRRRRRVFLSVKLM